MSHFDLAPGLSREGRPHASSPPGVAQCPGCGERIHADSLICCVCGRIRQVADAGIGGAAPRSQPRCRKALASLVLGCFSFLLLPGLAAVILGHLARRELRRARSAPHGKRLAASGLVLGYSGLIGTTLFLVLYGYPGPLRAAKSRRGESTVNSLNILNIALQAYSATYGKGFPEKLSQLGPPLADGPLNVEASGFVARSLASGNDDAYRFIYTVTARDSNGFPTGYNITADPAGTGADRVGRHYFTDQTQVIRTDQKRLAAAQSPPGP